MILEVVINLAKVFIILISGCNTIMPISDECRKQVEALVPEKLRLAPLASSAMYSLMPSPWNDGTHVDMILGGRCDRGERKGENTC